MEWKRSAFFSPLNHAEKKHYEMSASRHYEKKRFKNLPKEIGCQHFMILKEHPRISSRLRDGCHYKLLNFALGSLLEKWRGRIFPMFFVSGHCTRPPGVECDLVSGLDQAGDRFWGGLETIFTFTCVLKGFLKGNSSNSKSLGVYSGRNWLWQISVAAFTK